MCSMALVPRNGMLPCAVRPCVVDLEPVNAAMADADAVDVERLRDDHEVGPRRRDAALFAEPAHSRKAAALFVDGAADFDAAPSSSTPARRTASAA